MEIDSISMMLGRIDSKLDSALFRLISIEERTEEHDDRIAVLERKAELVDPLAQKQGIITHDLDGLKDKVAELITTRATERKMYWTILTMVGAVGLAAFSYIVDYLKDLP